MQIWKIGVYADGAHRILCFAGFVSAIDLRSAIAILRQELKLMPVKLYVGEIGELVLQLPVDISLELPTTGSSITLLRADKLQ